MRVRRGPWGLAEDRGTECPSMRGCFECVSALLQQPRACPPWSVGVVGGSGLEQPRRRDVASELVGTARGIASNLIDKRTAPDRQVDRQTAVLHIRHTWRIPFGDHPLNLEQKREYQHGPVYKSW